MNEQWWTKGEWCRNGINLAEVIVVHEGPDENGRHSVDGRHQHRVALFESVEDARLGAAAPDLYAALCAAEALDNRDDCDLCEGESPPEECELCFLKADDARMKRRAALVKARPLPDGYDEMDPTSPFDDPNDTDPLRERS